MYGRRRSFGGKKPVEVGQTYEVDITELSRRGEGLTRIQGFIIFVPGTKPGDHVKILITAVRSRYATARVVTEEEA
ncbi:MAG: TRAM domain-containing protein [archaeon GB-1867-005]|mgnify:CR=1 FL=1|nr:TRAM domain-containing protein [Candidatus Culexmicrobium cathedralense]